MSRKKKSVKELKEERDVRHLAQVFERNGIKIRRENLARGHSFRVKSGQCRLEEQSVIFVDRRLPPEQQLSVLLDYCPSFELDFSEGDVEHFSPRLRSLISGMRSPV